MCGIAGLFDPVLTASSGELARSVEAMTATLAHRGPDDAGRWCHPEAGIYLGHRRLAVLDLGPEGSQPMHSGDGRWVVSYNGELYNHRRLRTRLAGEGLSFRGESDTEVLVGAIERWGLTPALESAEGMFAVAVWDRYQGRLHLVRDRFGEKPLYYGVVGGVVAFGSELKALRALPRFTAEIDRDAVALYLRHNCVPAPSTIYRGVTKLPPGHMVTFDTGSDPGRLPPPQPYWSAARAIEQARGNPLDGPTPELVDQLEAVLSRSVAARMVADVPVGAFLSGGIDSAVVVALMQQQSTGPVRTFTVGFADRAFDESTEAAAVAAHLGCEHTRVAITDGETADVVAGLPDIWDEPFGDVSQIPMLVVSRLARTRVTVSLSGDGGDELFAGYNRHAWLERLWARATVLPDPVRRSVGGWLGRIPPGWVDGAAGLARLPPLRASVRLPSSKVTKVAKVLGADTPEDAYLALVSYWPEAESMVFGAGPTRSRAALHGTWPALGGITEQMMWLDTVGYLPDDILTKLDRAAMSASLETRTPFLDRDVFDLAWRLPLSVKLRNGTTKWLLRQVLDRHVPRPLVERPKMGFGFPIGAMLRGPLRPWAEELLGQRRLEDQGLLDPAPIRAAWRHHLAGRRDVAHELWAVLALQAWMDRWSPPVGHSGPPARLH